MSAPIKPQKLFLVFIVMASNICLGMNESWRFDTRFTELDIVKMVEKNHPTISSKSSVISHYAGYYSINPFLLAELASIQGLDVKSIAQQLSDKLSKTNQPELPQSLIQSVNKMMDNYNISAQKESATSDTMPVFDLPFDHDKAWYFRGVHTNTGTDEEGVPRSSIDLTSNWDLSWGAPTAFQWVAAAHDGVVTFFSGCYMRITHESGWGTGYYHLKNIQYRTGDVIKAGDRIANFANSYIQATCQGGEADTPHVHFELLKDGEPFALDGIEFSGWKIHSGEFSYDTRPDYMWIEKDGIKKYALTDTISHEPGENIIDYRHSGVYSSAEINGHGINITITQIKNDITAVVRNVIFIAFYTYDNAGKANFYAGNIDYDNWRIDETKTIEMIQTSGGNLTNMQAIDFDTDVINAGSMDLHFIDCANVEISFSLIEPTTNEVVNQDLVLTKSVGIPDHVCQAPSLPIN